MLEIHVIYAMNDGTVCQIAMRAKRITFQHREDGRLMVKFPESDGYVSTSDVRSPGLGLKNLRCFSFRTCDTVYTKDVTDE